MYRTHIDGVPVLRLSEPGPLRATLRFGAGARDEDFRTLGINRLIAALAVRCTARPEGAVHEEPAGTGAAAGTESAGTGAVGAAGPEETRFEVSGSPEEVAACLESLCRALSDLPAGRLGEVADVLDGGDTRYLDPRAAVALNTRFGSQAAGLHGHHRDGDHLPTEDMLRAHAAAWFTRSNAVVTLTGPVPAGLRLPLPGGERPRRTAPVARCPRPSWTCRETDGVALSTEAAIGSLAAAAAHGLLRERVTAVLSGRPGTSAPPEETTVLRDSVTVVRLLLADASGDDAAAVAATVWAEALRLAREEPAPDEVARHIHRPEGAAGRLRTLEDAARHELFGTPCLDQGSLSRAGEAVTPADVSDAWRRALAQAQVVVPAPLALDLAGPDGRVLWGTFCWVWDELPPWGEEFRRPRLTRMLRRDPDGTDWVVLTPDAVVSCRPGRIHELRFEDVIALERWGTVRNLIGRCGCSIGIDPSWYRGGERLVRAVDEAVPAHLAFEAADPEESA
ncbi:hypothetical protein [Streptomyces sp. NPDC048603]|uniref:hypothetical protein n=1 Tax=Streptomyces sp. NPDC048603 TaxID=3365577 RepID=UPI00371F20B8